MLAVQLPNNPVFQYFQYTHDLYVLDANAEEGLTQYTQNVRGIAGHKRHGDEMHTFRIFLQGLLVFFFGGGGWGLCCVLYKSAHTPEKQTNTNATEKWAGTIILLTCCSVHG